MNEQEQLETHAAVIAEMRNRREMLVNAIKAAPLCYSTEGMSGKVELLDELTCRLEAAHRRELAASGDAGKLREALEQIHKLLSIGGNPDAAMCIRYEAANQTARAALAAPPRNCDMYRTKDEAQKAFLSEPCDHPCGNCCVEDINNECGVEWLLAQATEQEGGAK